MDSYVVRTLDKEGGIYRNEFILESNDNIDYIVQLCKSFLRGYFGVWVEKILETTDFSTFNDNNVINSDINTIKRINYDDFKLNVLKLRILINVLELAEYDYVYNFNRTLNTLGLN